jgi:transcriptional regulator with XRE-family HTH domain
MELKDRLALIRNEHGLNRTQFARRIGSTPKAYSNYELGIRKPLDIFVNNICNTFSINKQWLLSGTGDMYDLDANKEKVDFLSEEHESLYDKLSLDSKIFIIQFMKYILNMQEIKQKSI